METKDHILGNIYTPAINIFHNGTNGAAGTGAGAPPISNDRHVARFAWNDAESQFNISTARHGAPGPAAPIMINCKIGTTVEPTDPTDLIRKVDLASISPASQVFVSAVIRFSDKSTATVSIGSRYIAAIDDASDPTSIPWVRNRIYQCIGVSPTVWQEFIPANGWACYVRGSIGPYAGRTIIYKNSEWRLFDETIDHVYITTGADPHSGQDLHADAKPHFSWLYLDSAEAGPALFFTHAGPPPKSAILSFNGDAFIINAPSHPVQIWENSTLEVLNGGDSYTTSENPRTAQGALTVVGGIGAQSLNATGRIDAATASNCARDLADCVFAASYYCATCPEICAVQGSIAAFGSIQDQHLMVTTSQSYMEYDIKNLARLTARGTVRFNYTPLYTGTPSDTQYIFCGATGAGGEAPNKNSIIIKHNSGSGDLEYILYDDDGTEPPAKIIIAGWSPTADTEYDIECNFETDSSDESLANEMRMFINGAPAADSVALDNFERGEPNGHFYIGRSAGDTNAVQRFMMRNLACYSSIVHVAPYVHTRHGANVVGFSTYSLVHGQRITCEGRPLGDSDVIRLGDLRRRTIAQCWIGSVSGTILNDDDTMAPICYSRHGDIVNIGTYEDITFVMGGTTQYFIHKGFYDYPGVPPIDKVIPQEYCPYREVSIFITFLATETGDLTYHMGLLRINVDGGITIHNYDIATGNIIDFPASFFKVTIKPWKASFEQYIPLEEEEEQ